MTEPAKDEKVTCKRCREDMTDPVASIHGDHVDWRACCANLKKLRDAEKARADAAEARLLEDGWEFNPGVECPWKPPVNKVAARLHQRVGVLEKSLGYLVEEADSSEWHYSVDCQTEKRADCRLCEALTNARRTLA